MGPPPPDLPGARSVAGPNPKVCARCGTTYADKDWVLLRLAERIDSGAVRRVVRDWPEALYVEVRCCAHCGHTIAAKRAVQVP